MPASRRRFDGHGVRTLRVDVGPGRGGRRNACDGGGCHAAASAYAGAGSTCASDCGSAASFLVKDFVEAPIVKPQNQSTCRDDLPGAVMTITMADISYRCPVYAGGQS